MAGQQRATHPGIEVRHTRDCRSSESGRCSCRPTYRAHVWSARDGQRIRKAFPTLAAARAWRQDAQVALRAGTMQAPSDVTLPQAAEAWLAGARDGSIRNRKGERYKPSSLRGYERCLRLRILPALGNSRLSEVRRRDLQAFVDGLLAEGLDPSTIKNTLNPLQAIYRRAVRRDELGINPTAGLEIPRSHGRRDRIADPREAAALVDASPTDDRAVWAMALYAGLRRGELRALRWSDVDLATGVIRVERGWDDDEGEIEGKTRASRRTVPMAAILRDELVAHKLRRGAHDGLVFGTSPTLPFQPTNLRRRALTAWRRAGLKEIALHEVRHTFASLMIAAGVEREGAVELHGPRQRLDHLSTATAT